MRKRILTALIALTVLTSGFAGVTAAETSTDTQPQQANGASVSFENVTTGGDTVTVSSVTLPDGGYVTIHDDTLSNDTLGSVAGTSAYLGPGNHENVTVTLTDPVETGTYTAMAHQETDGDRTYEFVASNGTVDGPYTVDEEIVLDSATVTESASVSMSDQPTNGDNVVVDRVALSEGGFVTVHDASVTEGETFESIRGTSGYLSAGVHEDVRVTLDDPVENDSTLVPMAHQDTDADTAYTFEESNGSEDGPYTTGDGSAVIDTAAVDVAENASASVANQSTGGNHVVVESAYLPEGGFVTIHDDTLLDGDTFDSVRGTSAYLEAGYHTDVVVTLDSPVENDSTVIAMPHQDSDGDENYTFVSSNGSADGPYTENGSAVTDAGDLTVSASVTLSDQPSSGTAVVVDRVDLSEGGFVTIHDATVLDGDTFDSVVGTSEYLEAGIHENVTVMLDERQTSGGTLIAMPHQDTDGDENYTFVESDGSADGPYTYNGSAVVDPAEITIEASIGFEAQSTMGSTVTIESVTLQDGGFVTVHDATVLEGEVFDSIRGTSEYLDPGTHENVTVTLDDPLTENTTLVPMAHRDTDGDEAYTFEESGGEADGPYVGDGGGAVVNSATVTYEGMDGEEQMTESMTTEGMTGTGTDGETTTSGGSGPGFTAVAALLAVVAAALLAARKR